MGDSARSTGGPAIPKAKLQMPMRRLVVLFHRFGPYHISRLNSAARLLHVHGIELSGTDRVYAWDSTNGQEGFLRQVVSPDVEREPAQRLIGRVAALLSACAPEAVAIPGWSHRGALAALLWCTRFRVPVVLMSESSRFDEVRRPWREALKRRIVALSGSALVGGRQHQEYITELGMPVSNIALGYDVVDNDHFRRGAEKARSRSAEERQRLHLPENYFLSSCRFVEKKNVPRLLDAFARYRQATGKTAWDLVLLGDGPLRPQLVELICRLGLSGVVHLPGFVQYEDLPSYYGLAGAFVHASTTEQWGLVVNEAMAAGLPVIVSQRCGCIGELVVSGRNGYSFDPFDPSELCWLLVLVASAKCDRQRLARQGRAIIADWSPDRFAIGLRKAADIAIAADNKSSIGNRLLVRTLINRAI
jgi:1,2-diacylglycerol 3-alpha-glucosyltransferase